MAKSDPPVPSQLTTDSRLLRLLKGVAAEEEQAVELESPLAPGTAVAHFRIQGVLGRGGMGIVYLARDERLDREVALKLIAHPHLDPQGLLEEARASAAVHDPRIATVFEVGEADGRTYLAMERVQGSSLRAWLQGRPPRGGRLELALEICRAVASLHRAGLVHCDLKPENVMLEGPGRIKLVDFGLARRAGGAGRSPGGTRGYVAPEVEAGAPPDLRSDVFALAVLLRELLPAARGSRLLRLLAEAESSEPAKRPASAVVLVSALESVLHARKRRRQVLATGVVALGAVGLLAWWGWHPGARRASQLPVPLSSKRLTGRPLDQPISDAAISSDGRSIAWVEDRGAFVAQLPELRAPSRFAVPEKVVSVQQWPDGWQVLSRGGEGATSVWLTGPDGTGAKRIGQGRFRFAAASPGGVVAALEGSRLELLGAAGSKRSLDFGPSFPCAAQWSPDGKFLAIPVCHPPESAAPASIEVRRADSLESVLRIESPRLVQFTGAPVVGWAPSGALLYALTDAPGTGGGASIWMRSVEPASQRFREPTQLLSLERSSPSALSMGAGGELLTLRGDVRTTAAWAELLPDGSVGKPTPFLADELDSRFSAFATGSTAFWGMSLREVVPQLVGPSVRSGTGSAQTWPLPGWDSNQVLFWEAALPIPEESVTWRLVVASGGERRTLPLPFEVREALTSAKPPPQTSSVRCARRAGVCLVAHVEGEGIHFWRLSPEGNEPVLVLRVPAARSGLAWDLSPDASTLAVADGPSEVSIWTLNGTRRTQWRSTMLHRVQSVACADGCASLYLAGVGDEPENFRIALVAEGKERTVASSSSTLFADLSLSDDGAKLGMTLKSFDTDVWLTQLSAKD